MKKLDNFDDISYGKKRKFKEEDPQPLNPKGKKPWKTILISVFLTIVGAVFLYTGYARYNDHTFTELLPFFLMAALLLIPGLYHVVLIAIVAFGVEGYSYDMLPNLDDG
mmetsp:Transcript_21391/g.24859  ORF Transcript_21391/g.24859 Transcript_21391/m.24859 type:complete len:109 (+) Transcript_21391:45-371(+)